MRKQKNANSELDLLTLILSVVAGVLWAIFGGKLVDRLIEFQQDSKLWIALVIGLYFGLLALVLIGTTWLCTKARGYSMPPQGSYSKAFLAALAIFVAAGLFQLLYSLNPKTKVLERSAYIFLIDDSGSINDPLDLREDAVRQVMATCDDDYPFAVYAFTDECERIRDIAPASEARTMRLDLPAYGLTDIVKAIQTVEKDIEKGTLQAGPSPRIILVTDGDSSQMGLHRVLTKANDMSISICTIGMPGSNMNMLQRIADLTGGTSVMVDSIDQLPGAMQTVAVSDSNYIRTLLSHRDPGRLDWLFSLMRIVFLIILGAGFIYIKSLILRTDDDTAEMLIPNLLAVLIGALCIEVGMNILSLQDALMCMLMCVGFTILLTMSKLGGGGVSPVPPGWEWEGIPTHKIDGKGKVPGTPGQPDVDDIYTAIYGSDQKEKGGSAFGKKGRGGSASGKKGRGGSAYGKKGKGGSGSGDYDPDDIYGSGGSI
ncbi:MAG: VWA domain-containing protein [Oscillospiraceae bacterium]|nr:VWA domain-containing protein [Oscillospiraceae bacterium]